jgi:aminoglycoside phosphotransferase (APT) family kinase protein
VRRADLDELVSWFRGRHGDALGVSRDSPYEVVPLSRRGDTSQRFRIRFARAAPALRHGVLLKLYGPERGSVDVAHELRGMRLAHAALGGPFRVPTPYACSAERRALFAEYCPTIPLAKALFSRLRWSRLPLTAGARAFPLELAAAAGQLLRRLHAMPTSGLEGVGEAGSAQVADGYDAQLRRLLQRSAACGIPGHLVRAIGVAASTRLAAARDEHARLVFQHNDFLAANLLYAPGVVYVTDFHTWRLGHHEYDISWFASALSGLARYRIVDPLLLSELSAAFLEQAGSSGGTPADAYRLQGLRAVHALHFACMLLEGRGPLHELAYLPRPRRGHVEAWLRDQL